jgi:hypothetical protein
VDGTLDDLAEDACSRGHCGTRRVDSWLVDTGSGLGMKMTQGACGFESEVGLDRGTCGVASGGTLPHSCGVL